MLRSTSDLAATLAIAAALALLPLVSTNAYILNVAAVALLFAVFASSWNLISGFAGVFSFGHQAFFGLGAYTSALLAMRLGLSPWVGIPVGGLAAAAAGLLVALPVLRIRSVPHVAIVTLAFAEILRIVVSNLTGLTRGELGLWGIPALPGFGAVAFDGASRVPGYFVALGLFCATSLAVGAMVTSRFGLMLKAIRDNQDAAESLGIDLARTKLAVFAIGAFLAGVAGAVYAHHINILTPGSVLSGDLMVTIVAMTLVGGRGTLVGPLLGALALHVGLEALRALADYRLFAYGALLLLTVTFYPNGLASLIGKLTSPKS